jgi:hypothetical protein
VHRSGVEIQGSVQALRLVEQALLDLVGSTAVQTEIAANNNADPAPYDHVLFKITVHKGSAPLNIVVCDDATLRIEGSGESLEAFALYFVFPQTAGSGGHTHFEFHEGNDWIAPTCEPVVISVK